jgi:hypothetical protein
VTVVLPLMLLDMLTFVLEPLMGIAVTASAKILLVICTRLNMSESTIGGFALALAKLFPTMLKLLQEVSVTTDEPRNMQSATVKSVSS